MTETEDGVLLAKFDLSRTLVLQWTAVSTLGFVIALAGVLVLYYALTGDDTAAELTLGLTFEGVWWWSLALSFLTFLALMALVVFPHELCHGIAIRAFGGEPRYGFGVSYFVFPYAFATSDTRLTRNRFVVVALAPLIVLTLLGVPLMVLFEIPWLAVPLALNAGGAVGDVWMSLLLLSYPAEVTVLDRETGVEVYGPPGTERWETAPATVVWDVLVGFTRCDRPRAGASGGDVLGPAGPGGRSVRIRSPRSRRLSRGIGRDRLLRVYALGRCGPEGVVDRSRRASR